MTRNGPGAYLAVWHDVVPEDESEYRRWHTTQHLAERVSLPGFLRGRRWVAIGAGERYCATMLLDDISAAESASYLERLEHPTDWTRAMASTYRNFVRCAVLVTDEVTRGSGGFLVTMRVDLEEQADEGLRQQLRSLADAAVAAGEVTTWSVGIVQVDVTARRTAESRSRTRTGEAVCDLVLMIECASRGDALAVHERLRVLELVAGSGTTGLYELEFDLSPPAALAMFEAAPRA
ncbi:MAG: hypothetical protein JWP32_2364 [Schumannella sp.]|nr:hypothetical protein [Schumannella sp.]